METAQADRSDMIWARNGWPDVLKDVRVTADTEKQRVTYELNSKRSWWR
jgi:hypothetical protein